MTDQLKPCPFCGSLDLVETGTAIMCFKCGATGPDSTSDNEDYLWNNRPAGQVEESK